MFPAPPTHTKPVFASGWYCSRIWIKGATSFASVRWEVEGESEWKDGGIAGALIIEEKGE